MSIFLNKSNNQETIDADILKSLLKSELGEIAVDIKEITGGANCSAFKIFTDKQNKYFVKKYFVRKGDNRDRLSTEFLGLSFLWKNGIKNIPEPLFADKRNEIGVYKFIDGRIIRQGEVFVEDINAVSDFVLNLYALINVQGSEDQPIASEACFSVKEYIDCVENRILTLKEKTAQSGIFEKLGLYMDKDLIPLFGDIKMEIANKSRRLGIDINSKIEKSEKILSPSDVGFHNIIKAEDGKVYFIDFEYYGWDDPVKTISDFYLQPAVPMPEIYRELFFARLKNCFGKDGKLERRLSVVYPILGLKWCLIMLNIFLRFEKDEGDEAVCLKRLDSAKKKLEEVRHDLSVRAFPISLA